MVKVKICGITNIEDARRAVSLGADALGFVFYSKSPRYVKPEAAAMMIRALPRKVRKVGVFVDASPRTVRRIAKACGLDMVQLHGNESAQACLKCKPYPVIKAFRVGRRFDPDVCRKYDTAAYLFDAYSPKKFGGTGTAFDWTVLSQSRFNCGFFLSGGLNSRNVPGAIRAARPDWVDASSSLESSPGKKDSRRVAAFIRAVKHGSKQCRVGRY
jgi:phosphoribosylanthranilate isomerase